MAGSDYWQKFWQRSASRRRLIRGIGIGSAGLGAAALVACGGKSGGGGGGKSSAPASSAALQPRSGDELAFAIADAPPSFDGHRETTFAMIHPVAPQYSTLLRFDQDNYPKLLGDVAESWTQPDAQTTTVKLRQGVRFHDGSTLSSNDVKVTYERITNPPPGVASARRASYTVIDRIETPDANTITFRLKQPSASFLTN